MKRSLKVYTTIITRKDEQFIMMTAKEDCTETIAAMMNQERKFYECPDYLDADEPGPVVSPLHVVFECAGLVTDIGAIAPDEKHENSSRSKDVHSSPTRVNSNIRSPCSSMNDLQCLDDDSSIRLKRRLSTRHQTELSFISSWRHEMLDWANTVVFTYDVDRETIPVAFSILDRYLSIELSSHQEPVTREDFQLYAMVSMYIAIKILVPFRKLAVETLIDMSRGFYSLQDVTETEHDILMALDWHLNPPIVMDYCRCFMKLFADRLPTDFENTCTYIAEMVLDDTYFMSKSNSMVALAAMLVATQRHGVSLNLTQAFLEDLSGLLNVQSPEFDAILRRMEVLC